MSTRNTVADDVAAWLARAFPHATPFDEPAPVAPTMPPRFRCEPCACWLTERACALRWSRANKGTDLSPDDELTMRPCVGCADGARRDAEGLGDDGRAPVLRKSPQRVPPNVRAKQARAVADRGLDPAALHFVEPPTLPDGLSPKARKRRPR